MLRSALNQFHLTPATTKQVTSTTYKKGSRNQSSSRSCRIRSLSTILFAAGLLVACLVSWRKQQQQYQKLYSNSSTAEFGSAVLVTSVTTTSSFGDGTNSSSNTTATNSNNVPVQQPVAAAAVRGVFVIKVAHASHATKTLCTLSHFFNHGPRYPVRIFADNNTTNEAMAQLQAASGGADVQVVVDEVSWKQLPPRLTPSQRTQVQAHCTHNLTTAPHLAMCTELNVPLGYVYMGYWRYMKMAHEPALQSFDYFVSLDADAYLTRHGAPDPFVLMARHNLTGIYNIAAFQGPTIARGVQEAAERVFTVEERRGRFLNSPAYPWFDEDGVWGGSSEALQKPSIWGCYYGGRLDFLRSSRYMKFAQHMAYSTYRYRTDEQAVIGVAWALLAEQRQQSDHINANDVVSNTSSETESSVWYLPKRGVHMGIFHHGWVDDTEWYATTTNDDNKTVVVVTNNTLASWSNFTEHHSSVLPYHAYHAAMTTRSSASTAAQTVSKNNGDDGAQVCRAACNKEGCG